MQHILSNSWHEILRFDGGDDVVAGVLEFAEKQKIESGWVYAIGSSKEVELGFYDLDKKEYLKKVFSEPLELLNAEGNLASMNDKRILHWHGVFGRADYSTIGGHIHNMTANATVEVFIHKLNEHIKREHDVDTGLNLLS